MLVFFAGLPRVALARSDTEFAREVEARVHALVNALRAEHALAPLEREPRLDATAQYFGAQLAARGVLDHHADGATPAARVKQRGYVHCVLSENIAFEYSSRGFGVETLARSFVDGWRDSPTHRENMLDAAVTQTGIGIARNAAGEYYAAQVFARPALTGVPRRAACPRR